MVRRFLRNCAGQWQFSARPLCHFGVTSRIVRRVVNIICDQTILINYEQLNCDGAFRKTAPEKALCASFVANVASPEALWHRGVGIWRVGGNTHAWRTGLVALPADSPTRRRRQLSANRDSILVVSSRATDEM